MKRIILILGVLFLMGCSTMRYGNNLKAPYSQKELELGTAAAIGFTVASIFISGYIIDQNKE